MVRAIVLGVLAIVLTLLLSSCANHDTPKFGKQVEPPYGWQYTYCPEHSSDIGCKNK